MVGVVGAVVACELQSENVALSSVANSNTRSDTGSTSVRRSEVRDVGVDSRSEQLSIVETHSTMEQEVGTDYQQRFDYSKDDNRFVILVVAKALAHWHVLDRKERSRSTRRHSRMTLNLWLDMLILLRWL